MSTTIPSILNVYPANESKGIVLSDTIRVIFDQEMDTTTINTGTFLLGGPDNSSIFSPLDVTPFDLPGAEDENIEASPYFSAPVPGVITFKKVDQYGTEIDQSTVDYDADGTLWKTMAIFTPNNPLTPNTDYFVLLAGDEDLTDAFDSGIKTRSVFDTKKTAGTGSGILSFYGGYTGNTNRKYFVRFTTAGAVGTAQYQWWKESDPLTVFNGISTTGERELEDGIFVTCDPDGSFAVGDIFEVLVIPAIPLENNYRWVFSTSNGAIEIPPSTYSASGIESITTSTGISEQFHVSSIIPADKEYGVEIEDTLYTGNQIIITFSDNIDANYVTDNISILSEAPIVDAGMYAESLLDWDASVSNNIVTITLVPGQLYENNIVIIKIKDTIRNTDNEELGTIFTSFFTTTFTPLYTNEHRIYLDLGNILTGVPQSTIMSAILEASVMADSISFKGIVNTEYYTVARREFTTCMAELLLLNGLSGNAAFSTKMSKSLGDFKVSRDGGSLNIKDKIADKEDCIARWQSVLTSGGATTPSSGLTPIYAVKGSQAYDRIQTGRTWIPPSGLGISSVGGANASISLGGRRRINTYRKRII